MLVFKGVSEIDVSDFVLVDPVVLRVPQPTIDVKATGRATEETATKLRNPFMLTLGRYGSFLLIGGLIPLKTYGHSFSAIFTGTGGNTPL